MNSRDWELTDEVELARNILLGRTCDTCVRMGEYLGEIDCTIYSFFRRSNDRPKNNSCCWWSNDKTKSHD